MKGVAKMAEKEIDFTQDGGKLKRQKDIYHHGPKPLSIICHLPDPPSSHWSLLLSFILLIILTITLLYMSSIRFAFLQYIHNVNRWSKSLFYAFP
jgi:hypothetical protein